MSNLPPPHAHVRTDSVLTQRWLAVMVALWGAGVLTMEALSSVGMVGCALALGVEAIRRRQPGAMARALRRWWMLWPFLAWALVAPMLAGHLPRGSGVARLMDWASVPVAAAALARLTPESRARAAWTWATLLLLSCLAAGLQHFGAWPSPEQLEPLAWTRLRFHRMTEPVPGAEGRFMGVGLVFHRLKFAHVGAIAVVWALAYGLRHRGRSGWVALGVGILGAVSVLAFPFARAASAALVLTTALLVGLALPRRLALALGTGVLVAGALAVAFYTPLRERFLTSATSEGNGDRNALLATGLRAVRGHPVAGVGPGRFNPGLFATADTPQHVREHGGKAHNQLVTMAAETGVVGAVLFLLLLAGLARKLEPSRWEGAAGLGSLTLFALLSLVHDPLFHAQFSMALALALGAAFTRDEGDAAGEAESSDESSSVSDASAPERRAS
ncbi:MAG: O-antigen ligase family protein [Myxococcaceae bacterium]|nr:O-antigen ligase family protein [Myxococcaceae bacterium]MCI0672437.1 O-antigen ligase family protein [Myxococcaceae bacterium]